MPTNQEMIALEKSLLQFEEEEAGTPGEATPGNTRVCHRQRGRREWKAEGFIIVSLGRNHGDRVNRFRIKSFE